ENLRRVATRMALDQRGSVLALGHAQASPPVLVGRAAGRPAVAAGLRVRQPGQEPFNGGHVRPLSSWPLPEPARIAAGPAGTGRIVASRSPRGRRGYARPSSIATTTGGRCPGPSPRRVAAGPMGENCLSGSWSPLQRTACREARLA